MLKTCRIRLYGVSWRHLSCTAPIRAPSSIDFLNNLEKTNSKLLQAVKRKIEDRDNWNSQLTPDLNTKQDIAFLKQLNETRKLQDAWDRWSADREALIETHDLLEDPDPDMRKMASTELSTLEGSLEATITQSIPKLVAPKSPTKDYGALIEMKSGAGGLESSLFLEELMRAYIRVCNTASSIPAGETDEEDMVFSWRTDIVEEQKQDIGGVKNAIFEVRGKGAYDVLRFESGVHRVQRVPATESQGRVHTSTVAVLVMPLVEESDKIQEDLFKMEDIKIETMRARGAGGQHVNKTESAVRLTHIPTGVTVAMQDERSQHQNKRRAFTVLRSRLLDIKIQKEQAEAKSIRQNLVKSYDRSEKIRTYNWAQDRVTDHRIGMSLMNLEQVMDGLALVDFLIALRKQWEDEKMSEMLA